MADRDHDHGSGGHYGRRTLSIVGFSFLFVFLIAVLFIAILFLVPGSNFFGVTSVNARNLSTTYYGPEVQRTLSHRNIIIESHDIDVEIRVRKADQKDAGTVQVWEDSVGVSFNSVNRTLVDFMQYLDDNGDVWHKIIIREPNGILSRRGYVYINLNRNDDAEQTEEYLKPYNFLLSTERSNVTFAADDADIGYLLVDKVTVANASGKITFPAPTASNPYFVDLKELSIEAARADVTCRGPISGNVDIKCTDGRFNFGAIGGGLDVQGGENIVTVDTVAGGVTMKGTAGNLTAAGDIGGEVNYECRNGRVSLQGCGSLNAITVDAAVNAKTVNGDFDFTATDRGNCTVNEVMGETTVRAVHGATAVYDAHENVTVYNRYGRITVSFSEEIDVDASDNAAAYPALTVEGFDGFIDLRNICGPTNVTVDFGGMGYVNADFRRIIGANQIWYKSSSRPNLSYGNINITIVNGIKPAQFKPDATAGARNDTDSNVTVTDILGETLGRGAEFKNNNTYLINGGGAENYLNVITSNKIVLDNRAK
jgi:hypothetical protein